MLYVSDFQKPEFSAGKDSESHIVQQSIKENLRLYKCVNAYFYFTF